VNAVDTKTSWRLQGGFAGGKIKTLKLVGLEFKS
jgi:hypothetical protein